MIRSIVMYLLFVVLFASANSVFAGYDDSKYQTKSEMCAELCGEGTYSYSSDKSEFDGRTNVVTKSEQPVFSFMFLTWGYYVAYYVIAILLAATIFRNARQREKLALNLKPIWWGVLVFIDPVLGILAYWVMNILDVPGFIERSSKIQA